MENSFSIVMEDVNLAPALLSDNEIKVTSAPGEIILTLDENETAEAKIFNAEEHIKLHYEAHPLWSKLAHFGYPSFDGHHMKIYGNYVVCYCPEKKIARWTFEVLTHEGVSKTKGIGWGSKLFFSDPTIDPEHRVSEADFKYGIKGGWWSLGHMAAKGNHKDSYENYKMTFVMTNMVPQNKILNEGFWINVEEFQQELTKTYPCIGVFTGTIVMDPITICDEKSNKKRRVEFDVIGKNHKAIAVPSSFFKIIICETGAENMDVWILKVPNIPIKKNAQDVMACKADLLTITRQTGLRFFKPALKKGMITFKNCNGEPCPPNILQYKVL